MLSEIAKKHREDYSSFFKKYNDKHCDDTTPEDQKRCPYYPNCYYCGTDTPMGKGRTDGACIWDKKLCGTSKASYKTIMDQNDMNEQMKRPLVNIPYVDQSGLTQHLAYPGRTPFLKDAGGVSHSPLIDDPITTFEPHTQVKPPVKPVTQVKPPVVKPIPVQPPVVKPNRPDGPNLGVWYEGPVALGPRPRIPIIPDDDLLKAFQQLRTLLVDKKINGFMGINGNLSVEDYLGWLQKDLRTKVEKVKQLGGAGVFFSNADSNKLVNDLQSRLANLEKEKTGLDASLAQTTQELMRLKRGQGTQGAPPPGAGQLPSDEAIQQKEQEIAALKIRIASLEADLQKERDEHLLGSPSNGEEMQKLQKQLEDLRANLGGLREENVTIEDANRALQKQIAEIGKTLKETQAELKQKKADLENLSSAAPSEVGNVKMAQLQADIARLERIKRDLEIDLQKETTEKRETERQLRQTELERQKCDADRNRALDLIRELQQTGPQLDELRQESRQHIRDKADLRELNEKLRQDYETVVERVDELLKNKTQVEAEITALKNIQAEAMKTIQVVLVKSGINRNFEDFNEAVQALKNLQTPIGGEIQQQLVEIQFQLTKCIQEKTQYEEQIILARLQSLKNNIKRLIIMTQVNEDIVKRNNLINIDKELDVALDTYKADKNKNDAYKTMHDLMTQKETDINNL